MLILFPDFVLDIKEFDFPFSFLFIYDNSFVNKSLINDFILYLQFWRYKIKLSATFERNFVIFELLILLSL